MINKKWASRGKALLSSGVSRGGSTLLIRQDTLCGFIAIESNDKLLHLIRLRGYIIIINIIKKKKN